MKKKNIFKEDGLNSFIYIIGGILGIIMLATIVTFITYATKERKDSNFSNLEQAKVTEVIPENKNTESASTEFGKTIEEAKNEINSINKINENINDYENSVNDTVENISEEDNSIQTSDNNVKEEKKSEFLYPVNGEIIKEYAKDNLIYSKTLDEWTTHTGVDIKADKATIVKASCEGTVLGIKNDPRYGLTVIIEHENGYKTIYANLLTAEFVNEGDKVDAGETIGTVGTSGAFESADEPHVHFEVLKDNEYQDPIILLGELIEE